jgi:hypothetical protein
MVVAERGSRPFLRSNTKLGSPRLSRPKLVGLVPVALKHLSILASNITLTC